MAYIREVIVERALVKACEKRGGLAYKLTVPGRINAPDRLLIMPGGRLIFVECKAPGQKARPGQRREHIRLQELGCEVHVLDSIDNGWIFDGAEGYAPEIHDDPKPKNPPAPATKVCCTMPDCWRARYAKGLCLRHWREFKANGKV